MPSTEYMRKKNAGLMRPTGRPPKNATWDFEEKQYRLHSGELVTEETRRRIRMKAINENKQEKRRQKQGQVAGKLIVNTPHSPRHASHVTLTTPRFTRHASHTTLTTARSPELEVQKYSCSALQVQHEDEDEDEGAPDELEDEGTHADTC